MRTSSPAPRSRFRFRTTPSPARARWQCSSTSRTTQGGCRAGTRRASRRTALDHRPLAYRYILPPLWPVYAWHDRKLGHKRHYDEAGLADLLRRAGLEHAETTYTGHAVKVLQLALDRLLPSSTPRGNRLWWRLERLDLRASHRPYGALQLNVVFRKPEEVTAA